MGPRPPASKACAGGREAGESHPTHSAPMNKEDPDATSSPAAGAAEDKDEAGTTTTTSSITSHQMASDGGNDEDFGNTEEGDNILDDILNTVDEKFDHDEDRRDYEDDDDDEDMEDDAAEENDRGEEEEDDDDSGNEIEEKEEKENERSARNGGGVEGCPQGSDISDDEEELETAGEKLNNSATTAAAATGDNTTNSAATVMKPLVDSDLSEVSKKSSESESSDGEEEVAEKKAEVDEAVSVKVEVAPAEEIVKTEMTEVKVEEGAVKEAAKKTSKNYDYATKINYLFRDARFFLVKSNNAENVNIAQGKSVWSSPPQNETKFNQAFAEARNVLLIFSVKESGKFCGLARLATESRRDGPKVNWILPPGLSAKALGGVFKIDWICRQDLSFQKVQHLYNPWNNGKPVKIGRDGQEIEPKVAEELCRLFPEDKSVDMTPILRRSKEAARVLRAKGVPVKRTGPLGDRLGGRGGDGERGRGGRGRSDRGRGDRMRIDRGRSERGRGDRGGRFDRGGRGGGRGDRGGRKRPRFDESRGPQRVPKMGRLDDRRLQYRGASPPPPHRYPLYDPRPPPTYADYLRSIATRPPPRSSSYSLYADPYLPEPPRYYEGPPTLSYRSRERSRSYDRSVEEFLRRTANRVRDRSRSRSPRDRSRDSRRYRR